MSAAEAYIHLLKGNLGAGCLALPLAFARLGVGRSLALFAAVASQGTYSMLLVLRCKGALQAAGFRVSTYDELGDVAFGPIGRRLIGVLVVTLQLGVCCVYISLLVTNSRVYISERASFLLVFVACVLLSLLRDISSLWPLSLAANVIMLCAIATAVAVSVRLLAAAGEAPPSAAGSLTLAAVARCISSQFFAYEGIALVLPVENAFRRQLSDRAAKPTSLGHAPVAHRDRELNAAIDSSSTADAVEGDSARPDTVLDAEPGENSETPPQPVLEQQTSEAGGVDRVALHFERVLLAAMGTLAALFALLGASVARAFPAISSGSVTAFLTQRNPESAWLSSVNALVSLAVLLTFPLQLQPAVLVVESLLGRSGAPEKEAGSSSTSWRGNVAFVGTRIGITTICTLVVIAVPALELLVELLGALCQASLAVLPFAIALQLHHMGILAVGRVRTGVHVLLMAFCAFAMATGTYCAIADIHAYRALRGQNPN